MFSILRINDLKTFSVKSNHVNWQMHNQPRNSGHSVEQLFGCMTMFLIPFFGKSLVQCTVLFFSGCCLLLLFAGIIWTPVSYDRTFVDRIDYCNTGECAEGAFIFEMRRHSVRCPRSEVRGR